jgi:hypothetical protein
VPVVWPEVLSGPLVWTGADFPDESPFTYYLTAEDQDEIVGALKHFQALGLTGKNVNAQSFPLPCLGRQLRQIRNEIYRGRGFAVLRGLDVDAFNEIDLLIVYLCITSYVAEIRGKQNHRGSMLSMLALFARYRQACLLVLMPCVLVHVVNSFQAVRPGNAASEMARLVSQFLMHSLAEVANFRSLSPSILTWSATS